MRSPPTLMLAVIVGACGGNRASIRPAATPAPAAPTSERAVAEPFSPRAQLRPRDPLDAWPRLDLLVLERRYSVADRGDVLGEIAQRDDLWDPCVREFVLTRDRVVRNLLGESLSQYPTSCGNPERCLKFFAPLRAYRQGSYIALVGSLGQKTNDVSLLVDHLGAPLDAERITVITDDTGWTSARLDFEGNLADHREAASLPYTEALARTLNKVIEAKDAVIRFEGPLGSDDLIVTDEMKRDLRLMIVVLEALSPP